MTELINALTRLANAATLYLEQQTHPKIEMPAGEGAEGIAGVEGVKKTRKSRATKAAEALAAGNTIACDPEALMKAEMAAAPAAAPASDPLAELGLPASAPAAAPAAPVPAAAPAATAAAAAPVPAYTPEQSVLEMKKIAVKCVQLFKNDTPNGEARLTGLLSDRYKVNRLSELNHENRLDFIGQVQAIIVAGGKA